MGAIFDLLKSTAGEASLLSRLGQWRQKISRAVDNLEIEQPFLTQTRWFVDPVNGDDSNDGTTAASALQTPGELARRWSGEGLQPLGHDSYRDVLGG